MNQLLYSPYKNTVEPQNRISTSLCWGGGHNLSMRLFFAQPKASCNTNSFSHSDEMAVLASQSHYVPLHLILIILLYAHLRNLLQYGLTSPQAPFLFQKPLQFNSKPGFFHMLLYPSRPLNTLPVSPHLPLLFSLYYQRHFCMCLSGTMKVVTMILLKTFHPFSRALKLLLGYY